MSLRTTELERPRARHRRDDSSLSRRGRQALAFALLSGAVTHGFNLFQYPLWQTDEGIYVQQAWSVIREGKLAPYTYFYDHAPGGWLMMAAWARILPGGFQTFGAEINTVRVLMLLVHILSVGLMFGLVRRVSGSLVAATVATFVFNFSPLAIYYQRMALLDNLMVMWVLLAAYLLIRQERRVLTAVMAGFAGGLAVITKENAVFFAPALAYLAYRRARGSRNRRFLTSFWWFTLSVPALGYMLYAQLKSELVPAGLSFNLEAPPEGRVSLLYTIWWQLNRTSESGWFMGLLNGSWLFRDRYVLMVGSAAVLVVLWLWSRDREQRAGYLAVALLAIGYAFYLVRGSVLLDFYVAPLVPMLAMNIGLAFAHLTRGLAGRTRVGFTAVVMALTLAVPGGYLLTHNTEGELVTHDLYHLELTKLQEQQVRFIRENIPPDARMVIDDDLWIALHDREPEYSYAHSHWKASSDPDIRDDIFGADPANIDYVVMSNQMREAMERNNGDGREDWILEAIDQHGELVWEVRYGDIDLEIFWIGQ
jgi:4-amino-4-deoxy-L-arabinose transferase and related glycosyltransferases of PMT family